MMQYITTNANRDDIGYMQRRYNDDGGSCDDEMEEEGRGGLSPDRIDRVNVRQVRVSVCHHNIRVCIRYTPGLKSLFIDIRHV